MAGKNMHSYIFAGVRCRSLKETIRMIPVMEKRSINHLRLNSIIKVLRYRVCQIRREIVTLVTHLWTRIDIEP